MTTANKKKKNKSRAQRLKTFRERKKKQLFDAENMLNPALIAAGKTIVSMICNSRKYTVIKRIFCAPELAEIKEFGLRRVEEKGIAPRLINFDRQHLKNRYEYEFYKQFSDPILPPDCLLEFLAFLQFLLPNVHYTRASIIRSIGKCPQQPRHSDSAEYFDSVSENGRRDPDIAPWSIIMALEPRENRTGIIIEQPNGRGKLIDLPPGTGILMRGDLRHAGLRYESENCRLFIALGTVEFPNDGETIGALNVIKKINRAQNV